jgi:hypothetical protein
MVLENVTTIYPFMADQAALMSISMMAPLISILAIALAIIPIMSFFAARREEKRRIREVAAIERQTRAYELQAEALYTISTQYNIVKRKQR